MKGRKLDLVGKRFFEWVVISQLPSKKGVGYWLCKCSCGKEKEIAGRNLVSGRTKSCGCLHSKLLKIKNSERRLNLAGKKFGMLMAVCITRVEKVKGGSKIYWLCKCDCGKEKEVTSSNLNYGWIKSCGCLKSPDLVGKKFGRWTVIQKGKNKCLCKCDCGIERKVFTFSLTSGESLSCGCLANEKKSDRFKIEFGLSSKRHIYDSYKRGAKRRGLSFDLTFEQLIDLANRNCWYCNSSPSNLRISKHSNGDFKYQGIDRKDNNIGYTLTNVVPCCQVCNKAKGSRSYKEFVIWIGKIVDHSDVLLKRGNYVSRVY